MMSLSCTYLYFLIISGLILIFERNTNLDRMKASDHTVHVAKISLPQVIHSFQPSKETGALSWSNITQ